MRLPTLNRIAAEWNRNAASRCKQLASGKDTSHDRVLVPAVLKLVGPLGGKVVLDVGCGCGFLTSKVAREAKRVLGIDISYRMIGEAKLRHRKSNLSFECISLEALAQNRKELYDVCLSNMSIITMPNLGRAVRALGKLVKPGGALILSIIHPCFWNNYRKDERLDKFDYWRCHAVTAPFRITFDQKPLPMPTTYFHRPLSVYFSSLHGVGFQLEQLTEPRPSWTVPKIYRRMFPFPRFIVLRARK